MMHITDQIHRAFVDVVRSGAIPVDHNLPDRIRDLTAAPEERTRLWVPLLDGYRKGPRQAWAAVLLEVLSKDITVTIA